MDHSKGSSLESMGSPSSSLCPVCQGIGDLKNPRGVSVKIQDDRWSEYAYVYMHYPSIGALYNSAEAGCDLCKLLRSELQRDIVGDFNKATAACSPEPDDASSIAADLAEFTRPENLHISAMDFKHGRSRRIVLLHHSKEGTGPRGDLTHFHIRIFPVGHRSLSQIRGFKLSREYIVYYDITIPLGDANTG